MEIKDEVMGVVIQSNETGPGIKDGEGGDPLAKPNSFLDNIGSDDPQPSSIEWGD